MVLLYSEQKNLGTKLPDFNLLSVDGKRYGVSDFKSKKNIVVMFICNHCPYVQAIEDRIIQLARDYEKKDVQMVAICSNDPTDYPDDRPEKLKARWIQKKYGFPYLIDETQDVAKAFGAVCTPDIFVYNAERLLVYRGQLDNNWKDPRLVSRHDLREVLDALLAGKVLSSKQSPSMGCSIKWKNEKHN